MGKIHLFTGRKKWTRVTTKKCVIETNDSFLVQLLNEERFDLVLERLRTPSGQQEAKEPGEDSWLPAEIRFNALTFSDERDR